jgi:2-polyprenyl-3-methyl-5-hydroxy-6-metoxy-1,4-benzoquinol methylase
MFYDNFEKRSKITSIGEKIVSFQNNFFVKIILKNLPKNKKKVDILEIGPGKGYFAEECLRNKFNYIGVESNIKMFKKLKKRGFNIYNQSVPPIKLNKKFDVIFANQVFEHTESRKVVLNLFKNCRFLLKDNGLLIVSVPDIRYAKEDFFGSDYTHNYPFSLYSLKQIFSDFGFKIKYENVYNLFFKGYFLTSVIHLLINIFYFFGIIKLFFGKKAYKIKNLANASCLVVGIKID